MEKGKGEIIKKKKNERVICLGVIAVAMTSMTSIGGTASAFTLIP